jgi:hypothetical protein
MSEQQIAEQVRDTIQRWVDGKIPQAEFDKFLDQANRDLDALSTEKKKKADEQWWRYSTTFC